jgi:hypothetical protein
MSRNGEHAASTRPTRAGQAWRLKLLLSVLATVLVLGGVLYQFSKSFQHRVSGFICAGDQFLPRQEIARDVFVLPHSAGYDGQFYYYLAKHPLGRPGELKYLDIPAYRYQRIGYPLLARLLAFGSVAAIPSTMLLINMLGIVVSVILFSVWLKEKHIDPLYASLFAFAGPLLYPLLRDLSEISAAVFTIGALLAYSRRRFWLGGGLLGYAMLCREVMFGAALVLVFDWLFLQKQKRAWATPLLAACMMFGWHLFVYLHTHAETYPFHSNFAAPGVGMLRHVQELFVLRAHVRLSERLVLATVLLIIVASVATAVWEFARSRQALSLGLLGYTLMPVLQGPWVWVEPWGYARMLVPSLTLLMACFARSGSKWYLVTLGLHALLFVVSLAWLFP